MHLIDITQKRQVWRHGQEKGFSSHSVPKRDLFLHVHAKPQDVSFLIFFACDVQLIADLPAVPEEANVRVNVT